MNGRTIAAFFVLGLAIGVAGIATARQAVEPPGPKLEPQATEKAKYRAQVVKLRVEVDLLQLELDAVRDGILASIKSNEPVAGPEGEFALEMQLATGEGSKELMEAMRAAKDEKERERLFEAAAKKKAAEVQASIDRKKKTYADHAAKLAEKRLDLEEAEIQYHSAR